MFIEKHSNKRKIINKGENNAKNIFKFIVFTIYQLQFIW